MLQAVKSNRKKENYVQMVNLNLYEVKNLI